MRYAYWFCLYASDFAVISKFVACAVQLPLCHQKEFIKQALVKKELPKEHRLFAAVLIGLHAFFLFPSSLSMSRKYMLNEMKS